MHSMDAISTNPICKPHSMHAINTVQIGITPNCPKMGGGKKGPKLSRLGELLNTQKNVHFFAPRGVPGGPKVHPPETPLSNKKNNIYRPGTAHFGPRAPGGRGARAPRGVPGISRPRKFPPPGARGGPGGVPIKGVKIDPIAMDAITCIECDAMHAISIDSINDAMHAMHVISIDPIHDALSLRYRAMHRSCPNHRINDCDVAQVVDAFAWGKSINDAMHATHVISIDPINVASLRYRSMHRCYPNHRINDCDVAQVIDAFAWAKRAMHLVPCLSRFGTRGQINSVDIKPSTEFIALSRDSRNRRLKIIVNATH